MLLLPSGYVKIAIENGHLYPFIVDFPIKKKVMFKFATLNYQRVTYVNPTCIPPVLFLSVNTCES